ncbi:MAG: acyl carrier protein [Calditrichia bacterium]
MQSVSEKLVRFLNENFMMPLDFSGKASLLENGIIDSTGVLELVLFLEENFGIKIEDDEIVPENLDTLQNLTKYLNTKFHQN